MLTRPDRPRGRGRRLASPPVATRARELGIPLEQPASVNDPEHRGADRPGRAIGARHPDRVRLRRPHQGAAAVRARDPERPSLAASPLARGGAGGAGDHGRRRADRRLDHAPDRGPRQRARVPCRAPRRSVPTTATARSRRALPQHRRRAAAAGARGGSRPSSSSPRRASPTRRRSPPRIGCSIRPGRRPSSSGWCVRCTRTSEPAWRWPTGRCSASTGPRWSMLGRPVEDASGGSVAAPAESIGAGVVVRDGRLLLDCSPGVLELIEVQPPGGRAMDAAVLPARSRAARAPVAAHVLRHADSRHAASGRVRARAAVALSGITPAQASQRVVLLVVQRAARCGPWPRPRRSGIARTAVAFSSLSLGGRTSRQRPRHDVLDDRLEGRQLLGRVGHAPCRSQEHHRAIVGRVVHRRARQHQPVDQRHRQARRRAGGERAKGAARHRAVQ